MNVDWRCPSCGKEANVPGRYGAVIHRCPKMGGLTTPYVRKGLSAKQDLILREDYVGEEKVRLDDHGRPVMSIVTTRDNGQDTTVFAPTATAKAGAHG